MKETNEKPRWTPSLYRRKEWFQFRELCLDKAGRKCERCAKTQKQTCLQVHHPYYDSGLMPWEYQIEFCEVLCRMCHAIEHGKAKPLTGWILIHSDWDNGEATGPTRCEHCDAAMEWHNDIWHPEWGSITVGYECAEKLGVPEAHKIKLSFERMNTFVYSPRWKWTKKGLRYKHGKREVFIMKKDSGFILNISGSWGKLTYPTILDAKIRSFRFIESSITINNQ